MHEYTLHEERDAAALRVVDDGIGTFNETTAPMHGVRHLACFVRHPGGGVIGGAVGRSWGENAELQQLWLPAEWRGRGIGAALLRRFEQAARERGARRVYLDTFSFQAPAFYERLAYARALEIPGFAPGISKFTMLKELGAA